MSLVNLNQAINYVEKSDGALGAFNVSCWEMAPAIIAAAEKTASPIVIQSQWPFLKHVGIAIATKFLVSLAEKAAVPVVLQLDHARDWEQIMICLRAGFSSIMIDASHLPLENNIQLVSEVVNVAHAMGVTVESELGRLSGQEDEVVVAEEDTRLTDPEEASFFVERTQVDALAVSVGTVHGSYSGELNLDFDRLKAIKTHTSAPLVLHGASGVPADALQKVVSLGIKKINFSTELREAWLSSMRRELTKQDADPMSCTKSAQQAVTDIVASKIHILSQR
ncbi:MAG: class II fructose-bisphosphate aldolase [Desulfocapsa sp.]|nr:class II fructose-bisphosphate aldolase [Desulfocapsa sp.]